MLFFPWNQTEMKFKNNYFHFNNIKSSIPGLVFLEYLLRVAHLKVFRCAVGMHLYLIVYNFARFTRCAENDTVEDHFRCVNVMVCYRTHTPQKTRRDSHALKDKVCIALHTGI